MFLIPVHPPFYAPLFDRLAYHAKNIPVQRVSRDRFILDEGLKTEWISLERNLRAIAFAMIEICTVPLPKFFNFWAFPKRFGYEQKYSSSEIVQNVAIRSRDAFVPLIAALTLLLLILNEREVKVQGFSWRERVLKKTGIHHQWLSALEDSVVGDLSAARVGGIVYLEQCEYKGLLPLLVENNVPIYLCWGDLEYPPERPPQFLAQKHFVPTAEDIYRLRRLALLPPPPPLPTPVDNGYHAPFSPTGPSKSLGDNHAVTRILPPVEKYSRQKEGEHWEDFFRRQEATNKERASRETAQQRESRLNKDKSAQKHAIPGRRGARVFFWEDPKCLGFRIRRAVGYNRYQMLWSNYNRSQRRYDSFNDEWDICTDFGDGDPDSDDDYESDSELMEWFQGSSVDHTDTPHHEDESGGAISTRTSDNHSIPSELLPDSPHEQNLLEGEYSSAADLMRVHGGYEDGELPNDAALNNQSFEDTAYYRFGFSQLANVEPAEYHVSWKVATEFLGNGRWSDTSTSVPGTMQDNICTFLSHLWASEKISSIPPQIYDMWQPESDLRSSERSLRVTQNIFNKDTYFFLRPWDIVDSEAATMELSITSAATLLEILRRPLGPDLSSVEDFLINKGIAFNTFIRGPQTPPVQKAAPRYRGLGFRPLGYCPDSIDYQTYVSSRNRFFKTSRGRAALMAGGLVARLARDVVPYIEAFYGPSDTVFLEGMRLWDGNSSSPGYWDDKLTEDELDLICGVYKIATGINSFHSIYSLLIVLGQYDARGPQTTDLSWWPKPSIWGGSGLYVGYWSEDCEKWYQSQVQKYISGTAPLKNPKEWRHTIRFNRDVPRMTEKNERRATEYLKLLETF